MKKAINRIILIAIIYNLFSCTKNTNNNVYPKREYSDVEDYIIQWNDIFSIQNPYYFIYIYSKTCFHCIELKDYIIGKRLDGNYPIYYEEYNDDIPIIIDANETIGKHEINDLGIVGYPSLIKIVNHIVTHNVAGKKEIYQLFGDD